MVAWPPKRAARGNSAVVRGSPTLAVQVKASGARVICQVQNYDDAELAVAGGADVIVAQGTEAGGHTGTMSVLPFLAGVAARYPETDGTRLPRRQGPTRSGPPDPETSAVLYGQSAGFVNTIRFAADLVRTNSYDAEHILRSRPQAILGGPHPSRRQRGSRTHTGAQRGRQSRAEHSRSASRDAPERALQNPSSPTVDCAPYRHIGARRQSAGYALLSPVHAAVVVCTRRPASRAAGTAASVQYVTPRAAMSLPKSDTNGQVASSPGSGTCRKNA